MPNTKVVCPHCGHDGTLETSRPPLGSYGFNCLAEGAASHETMSTGAGNGTGAKLECRSCWRTFPIPEDLQWAVVPMAVLESESSPAAEQPDAVNSGLLETAAGAITQNLLTVLRSTMQQTAQSSELQIAKLDADLAALNEQVSSASMAQEMWLGRIAAVEAAVRAQQANYQELTDRAGASTVQQQEALQRLEALSSAISRLEQQTVEFRQAAETGLEGLTARIGSLDGLNERVAGLEEGLRTGKEGADQLRAVCAQLETENEALRQRLDAQAGVIRTLHNAAIEQTAKREELRAAVQRLGELTSSATLMNPLPEQL